MAGHRRSRTRPRHRWRGCPRRAFHSASTRSGVRVRNGRLHLDHVGRRFHLAEDVGVDGRIHSFGDAIWWSSATITTVGYGDVAPITVVGRLIGVVTMVVGISTFAVITAKMAEFLVRADRSDSVPVERDPSEFDNAANTRDGIAGDPDLS